MSVFIKTLQSDGGTLSRLMELQHDGRLLLEFDERHPYMQFIRDEQKKGKFIKSVIASLLEGFNRIYTTPQIVLKY